MLHCPQCSRPHPHGSRFCFHDGRSLGGRAASPNIAPFARPFVFPSGRSCNTFDELARACIEDWPAAIRFLREGALAAFLAGLGRNDLAVNARQAATFPDVDSALDEIVRGWPTVSLQPARLQIAQPRMDLGRLSIGQQCAGQLRLRNVGMGFLGGTIRSDVPWLSVGEGAGGESRHFGFTDTATIAFHIQGKALRASTQPIVGRVLISSSGGEAVVEVVASVPPVPFSGAPLEGVRSPRQLAEKAKANPREAAPYFMNGAVARWYAANGWTYPVERHPDSGLAAVQQFFDALGLSTPPRLSLSEQALSLAGPVGASLAHTLRLSTPEKRPIYAHAVSDQAWLTVRDIQLDGGTAHLHLSVPSIPDRPGETLQARLTIHGNARQVFHVPVCLRVEVSARGNAAPIDSLPTNIPASLPVAQRSIPRWTPLEPAQNARAFSPSIAIAPPATAKTPARLWMLAIPLGLIALLAMVGTLIAVVSSRPDNQTAHAGLNETNPADDPSPISTAPNPDPEREVISLPVRKFPQRVIPRPRLPEPGGREPILLPQIEARKVEVVFCLDTTGSMGGLLDGAKQKIWAICNQIAGGRPTPALRVGLVAFRDKGDIYITKVIDLSRDLDSIYTELNSFMADGGGDTPEAVNHALDDSINKIAWSRDKKTLKILFLVGDAPPHMDYTDDVKFPITCKKALERGIYINTIQCGSDTDCKKFWKDISGKAEGEYVAIPQTGGVVTLTTVHDGALLEVGKKLFDTALIYGGTDQKRKGNVMVDAAKKLSGPTAADRVAFAGKSKRIGPFDLIDAIRARKVKLEEVQPDELPEKMKELNRAELRHAFVEKVMRERATLYDEAIELEKKRADAMAKELARRGGAKDSFDNSVLQILRKQAKKFDIKY